MTSSAKIFIIFCIIIASVVGVLLTHDLMKLRHRVDALEESWDAHHSATTSDMSLNFPADSVKLGGMIESNTTIERDSILKTKWSDAVGLPRWQSKEEVIDKWRRTFPLFPDTTSVMNYHTPIDGEIVRVREYVLYVYSNGRWYQVEMSK